MTRSRLNVDIPLTVLVTSLLVSAGMWVLILLAVRFTYHYFKGG